MTTATANLPSGGSDSATAPTDIDSPEALDFWEPDEQSDANPETGTEQGNEADSETAEADSQEAETPDETAEDEDGEAEATPEVDPDAVFVTLQGGEQVPVSELKLGYMRDRDYRHKTTEVANRGRELSSMTERVTQSVEALAGFLERQIPPPPDLSLLHTNPTLYVQQKAFHEQARDQLFAVLEQANVTRDVGRQLTDQQRTEILQSENAKLIETFPQTRTPEGRQKFFETAAKAARELGYSPEDIKNAQDHRIFALAHYAAIGMKAEAARKTVAKKVENVPPVVPGKKAQQAGAATVRANKDAMSRLSRTGSINDAMSIDFD